MAVEVPLQIGIPGGVELLVVLLIAVLLFGANKIPKLARASGRALGEFQKGREELKEELSDGEDGGEATVDKDVELEAETVTEDA